MKDGWFCPLFDPERLKFATSAFLAGMLAMYITMSIGLPRPWWALMTVSVTMQPLSGDLRPKMVYRLIGIVVGALVAVTLETTSINDPLLLSFALAAWIGLCLFFSVLDRTPRAFIFMLAGYTAAIIGFPYIDQPREIFTIALERVEEMAIAVACVSIVDNLLRPWRVTSVMQVRVEKFLKDATDWIAAGLRGQHNFGEIRKQQKFALDITELGILSLHLEPDPTLGRLTGDITKGFVHALQNRLSLLLPLVSAAADRLDVLRCQNAVPETVALLVDDIVRWLEEDTPTSAAALQCRCRDAMPDLSGKAEWNDLLTGDLCRTLMEFVEIFAQSHAFAAYLRHPTRITRRLASPSLNISDKLNLQRDYGLALVTGLGAATSIFLYCTIWIFLAWPEGLSTAAFAAVISCSFVAQDDPMPFIAPYLRYSVLAIPISAFYLFAVLPATDGFMMLALVLFPVLMAMGYLQADPARAGRALAMLACFIVAMGFLERYTADFARFLNVALAQIGGIVSTIGTSHLFRSMSAQWSARRLLRQSWGDLSTMATAPQAMSEGRWTAKMLDRLVLLIPRLVAAELADVAGALKDLRIGQSIIRLQQERATNKEASLYIERVLIALATLFRYRAKHGSDFQINVPLLNATDTALSHLENHPAALLALTSLRRDLFPDAAPYENKRAA